MASTSPVIADPSRTRDKLREAISSAVTDGGCDRVPRGLGTSDSQERASCPHMSRRADPRRGRPSVATAAPTTCKLRQVRPFLLLGGSSLEQQQDRAAPPELRSVEATMLLPTGASSGGRSMEITMLLPMGASSGGHGPVIVASAKVPRHALFLTGSDHAPRMVGHSQETHSI